MLDLDYMLDSIQLHRVCLESVGIMYTASLKYTVKVIISEGKYYTVGFISKHSKPEMSFEKLQTRFFHFNY